jgi:tRNA-dihydrouridine synthase
MIGRAVESFPWGLSAVDAKFSSEPVTPVTRREVVQQYTQYVAEEIERYNQLQAKIYSTKLKVNLCCNELLFSSSQNKR